MPAPERRLPARTWLLGLARGGLHPVCATNHRRARTPPIGVCISLSFLYGSSSKSTDFRPFIAFALVAIVLTFWQHRAWRVGALSVPEYVTYLLVTPVEVRISRACNLLHNATVALASAPRLAEENRRLREECARYETNELQYVRTQLELKALRNKLGLEVDKPLKGIPAQVVSRSSRGESRWVRIRTTTGKPLEVGNVVKEAKGLVGRVVEADGPLGRVVLLVDPEHAVRAKDLRTGDEGMIHAASELRAGAPNRLVMEKTRQGARIDEGDTIVTADLGGTYPGGIEIGVVERICTSPTDERNVVTYVKPFVDFDQLNYVWVLRAGEQ
jgi:rod shape-determining protein MreC